MYFQCRRRCCACVYQSAMVRWVLESYAAADPLLLLKHHTWEWVVELVVQAECAFKTEAAKLDHGKAEGHAARSVHVFECAVAISHGDCEK